MGQRLRHNKYIFFGDVLQFDARYRDPSPNWGVIGLKLMTVTKKHQGGESRTRDGEFQELGAGSVDQLQITKCSPILASSYPCVASFHLFVEAFRVDLLIKSLHLVLEMASRISILVFRFCLSHNNWRQYSYFDLSILFLFLTTTGDLHQSEAGKNSEAAFRVDLPCNTREVGWTSPEEDIC